MTSLGVSVDALGFVVGSSVGFAAGSNRAFAIEPTSALAVEFADAAGLGAFLRSTENAVAAAVVEDDAASTTAAAPESLEPTIFEIVDVTALSSLGLSTRSAGTTACEETFWEDCVLSDDCEVVGAEYAFGADFGGVEEKVDAKLTPTWGATTPIWLATAFDETRAATSDPAVVTLDSFEDDEPAVVESSDAEGSDFGVRGDEFVVGVWAPFKATSRAARNDGVVAKWLEVCVASSFVVATAVRPDVETFDEMSPPSEAAFEPEAGSEALRIMMHGPVAASGARKIRTGRNTANTLS